MLYESAVKFADVRSQVSSQCSKKFVIGISIGVGAGPSSVSLIGGSVAVVVFSSVMFVSGSVVFLSDASVFSFGVGISSVKLFFVMFGENCIS